MQPYPAREPDRSGARRVVVAGGIGGLVAMGVALALVALASYRACRIDVPTGHQAVLVRKAGLDLPPDAEIAPAPKAGRYYKGIQPGVLTEGRYFYNPYNWDWEIRPQFEVPVGKIGVRIALAGDDLPAGQVLAGQDQKGIQVDVLKPGRYPYNWYAEEIGLYEPVTVPPGFQGVVTLLAGTTPQNPNVVLVGTGERGVQKQTLAPGTYFLNPFATRVSLVDCRSKRFNLGEEAQMDFLSADGFPVTLDGAIEFRVTPEKVAEVFVLYNEDHNGDSVDEEIIAKIITPESRSICRINGSRLTGGQFISGVDREQFQENFDRTLKANCARQGIEILAVAITSIRPPEAIATPVREREVAKQQLTQYEQERLQQESEAQLKVQEVLAEQRKSLVEAEQSVVELTTKSQQEQGVAKTASEQRLAVAKIGLEAVKARAQAITAEARANADVIRARNKAELSGLSARVQAFGGDGGALAQNLLVGKLGPGFRSILSSSDGPLMELFGSFAQPPAGTASPRRSPPLADASPPPGARPAPSPVRVPRRVEPAPAPAGDDDRAADRADAPSPLPADPFADQPDREAQP
jgi:regulator of protease activity HflC (stomatin/prohibitin superfamily)